MTDETTPEQELFALPLLVSRVRKARLRIGGFQQSYTVGGPCGPLYGIAGASYIGVSLALVFEAFTGSRFDISRKPPELGNKTD